MLPADIDGLRNRFEPGRSVLLPGRYCPADQGVCIDPSFFDILRQQFGASADELAQLYIVGHGWGHHIQDQSGFSNLESFTHG